MTQLVQIVTLKPEDWQLYRELRLEAVKEFPEAWGQTLQTTGSYPPEKWQDRIREAFKSNTHKLFFAKLNGRLVGMIGIRPDSSPKSKHVARIFSVYVKAEFQGQRIGSKLMERAIKACQQAGSYRKISLKVVETQQSAIQLYKYFGFEIVGTLKDENLQDGKYYTQYIMEKFLSLP